MQISLRSAYLKVFRINFKRWLLKWKYQENARWAVAEEICAELLSYILEEKLVSSELATKGTCQVLQNVISCPRVYNNGRP